jgi:hypothetical protein
LKKGEAFAESKSFFGLFKSKCAAPVDSTLESISTVTGQAILREPPIPVEVDAYVDGTVVEVHAGQGRDRGDARELHPGDLRRRR